jgi:tetratricopeptide (TPR) repeat protein
VFSGGCTLEAAEAVCASRELAGNVLDLLAALVDRSLLLQEPQPAGVPRFTMLGTVREYALERLAESAPAEQDDMRRRHAAYFVALAERAEAGLEGPDQPTWLRRLDRDHDNLRVALHWAADRGDAETAVRLGGALWRFWWVRGYVDEGMRSLDAALAHAERASPSARAKAFHAAGKLAREWGDYDRATELCRASLALFRELGDRAGAALALNTLANVTGDRGDYDAADRVYEESLALRRALGDRSGAALALHNLAAIACARGDLARAESLDDESLALFRAADDEWGVAIALSNQARTACRRGELERATALLRESLLRRRTLGDRRGAIVCLELAADLAERSGRAERAARLRGASEGLRALMHFVRPPDELASRGSGPVSDARLATPALRAAWEDGRRLDLDAAIDEALERADGDGAGPGEGSGAGTAIAPVAEPSGASAGGAGSGPGGAPACSGSADAEGRELHAGDAEVSEPAAEGDRHRMRGTEAGLGQGAVSLCDQRVDAAMQAVGRDLVRQEAPDALDRGVPAGAALGQPERPDAGVLRLGHRGPHELGVGGQDVVQH